MKGTYLRMSGPGDPRCRRMGTGRRVPPVGGTLGVGQLVIGQDVWRIRTIVLESVVNPIAKNDGYVNCRPLASTRRKMVTLGWVVLVEISGLIAIRLHSCQGD